MEVLLPDSDQKANWISLASGNLSCMGGRKARIWLSLQYRLQDCFPAICNPCLYDNKFIITYYMVAMLRRRTYTESLPTSNCRRLQVSSKKIQIGLNMWHIIFSLLPMLEKKGCLTLGLRFGCMFEPRDRCSLEPRDFWLREATGITF